MAALLRKRTVILVKEEASEGADSSPGVANAILAYDAVVTPTGDKVTRDPHRKTLSPISILIGARHSVLTFQTEIYGAGVAVVPRQGDLFEACGMVETVTSTSITYKPTSASLKTCTIYVYRDGLRHILTGCRGTYEIIMAAGQPARINWNFMGTYSEPTDVALPTVTFEDNALSPPKVLSSQLTFDGSNTVKAQQVQIVLGNTIAIRPSISAASGIIGFAITNRVGTGSLNPEAELAATRNWHSFWTESTPKRLTVILGDTAGNTIHITVPQVVLDSVGEGEREGVLVFELPFSISSPQGDDEVQVTYATTSSSSSSCSSSSSSCRSSSSSSSSCRSSSSSCSSSSSSA